jgi:tellurite resistance protein
MQGRTKRIPPNYFGSCLGLAGLAEVWAIAADQHRVPPGVGTGLSVLAALVWLGVLIAYLLHLVLVDHKVLEQDLGNPVTGPFLSLALITPMLLAVLGIYPHAATAGKIVFDVFLVLTVLLGGWFTGQWMITGPELDQIHPGYFLPTVAGGLIASDGAAITGQHRLAEVMFGYGMICWVVLGSIILTRLFTRPLPPKPLIPTLAIEIAPPAVASLAWFDAHSDGVDAVASGLAGYGLLMILVQLRLLPIFVRLPYMPSTWSFTFPWAAVAAAGLHWLGALHPTGYAAWQWVVIVAITVLVGAIAVRGFIEVARWFIGSEAAQPAEKKTAQPA